MNSVPKPRGRPQRAELSLQERDEMFRQLAENIDQVLWMTDLARSGMLYVSPAYETIWGRSVESLLDSSCSWLETIHPEDRGRILRASGRQVDGSYREEYRIMRPDGTVRWIQDRAFPIRDASGAVFRIAGIARDITERVQAQAELRRLSDVIEHSPLAMVIVNRERNVEYVNHAVLAFTGYERHEVMGKCTRMFRSIATADAAYDAIIAEVMAGRQWQGEHYIRHKSGRDVPVNGVWAPLCDAEGRVTHIVLIGRDITEERRNEAAQERLQRQLMQAQKMEAVGQLAGGIAHDFNNILVAVLGYSNMALQRFGSAQGNKLTEYLKEVVAAGERGRDLVAKLLTYSRAEPDQQLAPVDLAPLVRDTAAMLAASIPASVVIGVDVGEAIPPVLLAPVDLQQVLMNLAINARDATGERGLVRIQLRRTQHADVDCAACHRPVSGEFVELTVSDNGRGIEPEALSRIFDPFFTTKELGKGTGLGLSVVAGIVHKAGGHILLESQADAGTTVRVCLPIAGEGATMPATPPEAPATSAAAESAGSGRVLLVDDEPSVAKYLGELLESHGYRVTIFNNPVAALRCFEANPLAFDLILTDQTMPGMTGVDLTRAVLARRPGMPVILASGYSSSVNAATAREVGASAFVPKPVSAGKLLQLMGRVVSGAT